MQQFFLLLAVLAILAAIVFLLYLFLTSRFNEPNAFLIASSIVSLVVFGSIYITNSADGNAGTKFDVDPNNFSSIKA